ncbi:hypothetical protein GL420_18050 [Salmonella enterica]|nr:hypothetical protein [Salmonella enterica]EIJ8452194.1 hypothetical protein [Salmonella enterica]
MKQRSKKINSHIDTNCIGSNFIIVGRTGHGKTSFLQDLMKNFTQIKMRKKLQGK